MPTSTTSGPAETVNLLLFSAGERDSDNRVVLRDRRFIHLREILGSSIGDQLRVGEIDGARGRGTLESLHADHAVLRVQLDEAPPAPLPLTVVLALPRPKMLRRILRTVAEVGVKDLHLINSYRVEKSFWQSPLLAAEALREALLSGLEQAGDTVLPQLSLHRRFRPFAEDVLPQLTAGRSALLAQPGAAAGFPAKPALPGLIAVGPEGGFIPFEQTLLEGAGCAPARLGPRILRVETALHCLLGRYLPGE